MCLPSRSCNAYAPTTGSLLSQSRVAASPQMAFGASTTATKKKVVAKKSKKTEKPVVGWFELLFAPTPNKGKGVTGNRKDFAQVSYDKRPKGLKAGVGMGPKTNPKSKKINRNVPRAWSR